MAEVTYLPLSKQLRSRWHTAPFVRLTIGAWRRISTHGAVNGLLLGWRGFGDSLLIGMTEFMGSVILAKS